MSNTDFVCCPMCKGAGKIKFTPKVPIQVRNEHKRLAKELRNYGFRIREIASLLGYQHPGSITNLLQSLKRNNQ
jgi:uncharacterized protein YbaR (Trm112 family)